MTKHLPLALDSPCPYIFPLAIHEIFAANARTFPERECVVETKGAKAKHRTFTYRQINESSNQLARHFLAHGCEVVDTVMIYAYRGQVLPSPSSQLLMIIDIAAVSTW